MFDLPPVEHGIDEARVGVMKTMIVRKLEAAKVGWVLLWALGVPIPILLILFLLRGCT